MDKAKAIDKIKKALNLAADAAASPGEVAAALNSASKLMEKYGVDEQDVGFADMAEEAVHCSVQVGPKHNIPAHLTLIANLMCRAFGVKCVFTSEVRVSDLSWVCNYYGPAARVVTAGYTHVVLQRQIDKGWAQYLATHPYVKGRRGARTGYVLGWCEVVSDKVMKFAMSEEEAQLIKAFIEDKHSNLRTGKSSNMKVDGNAAHAGQADAKGFQLHRPMNGAEYAKLGH